MASKHSHAASRSTDTLAAMQEIDPSPVEESPINTRDGEYFPSDDLKSPTLPPPATSRASTASSLGLSGHNLAWWLTRTQRYSSYAFTAYVAAHLTNTSLLPLLTRSVPESDTYLLLTRPCYQTPLLEPLLIFIPAILHVASGIALRIHRRRQAAKRYGADSYSDRRRIPWPAVSGISALGFALTPLIAGHVLVNRLVPLWVDGGSSGVGLSYVAHGFTRHPAVAFTGYTTLVGIACWHFVWGAARYLGLTPGQGGGGDAVDRGLRRKRRWYGVNGVAALLTGLWLAGGLGVVGRGGAARGWIGKGFDGLYRSVPVVGRWM